MRESRGDNREGLATAKLGSAPDDAHLMAMALIAVTLPIPIMAFPQLFLRAVTRWSVRSRISASPECFPLVSRQMAVRQPLQKLGAGPDTHRLRSIDRLASTRSGKPPPFSLADERGAKTFSLIAPEECRAHK